MGLSSKQVSSTDRLDWALNELLQDGGMELPKATASRQQLQQQQQQSEPARCPRCDSTNTKFCYYNNYNRSQPRHFCKTCRRHWTKGGTLRNVPVGGGRKNKRRKTANSDAITTRQAPIQTQQQQQSPTLPFSDQNNMPEILYRSLLHHQLQPDFSSNTHERYNTSTTNNNNNNFTTFLDSIRCLPPMPPIFAPLTSLSSYENEPSLSSLASEEVFEVGKEEIDLQLMNSHIALATPWPGQTSTFLDSVTWNWEDLASNFDAASDLKHPYENPSCVS